MTVHVYSSPTSMLARRIIADIFELNHRGYGYRGMGKQVFISEKLVRRLMMQKGLAAATTKRHRDGSYRREISPALESLISLNFHPVAPK